LARRGFPTCALRTDGMETFQKAAVRSGRAGRWETKRELTAGLNLPIEPRSRVSPVTLGGRRGDAKNLRGLLDGQADEVAQLHEFGFARVMRGEGVESFVNGEQFIISRFGCGDVNFARIDVFRAGSVTGGKLAPRALNENAPHRLGSRAEEVRAIFESLLAKPQPRFMHERGGLERVAGLLAGHFRAGQRSQFPVNLPNERGRCAGFTLLDGFQEQRNVGHGRLCYASSIAVAKTKSVSMASKPRATVRCRQLRDWLKGEGISRRERADGPDAIEAMGSGGIV
jgi:hypothetical protein